MNHESPPRAWVETDVEAVAHNLRVARRLAGGALQMPIVKANAYGHGLEAVARRLDAEEGVAFFGVANVGEARRLMQAGVEAPPFILGPTFAAEREEIVRHNWGCVVSSLAEAEHFDRLAALSGRRFALHLALDTGMGREGFLPEQLGCVIPQLKQLHHLRIEGAMSHFSSADEDPAYTAEQIRLFGDCVRELGLHFELTYRHLGASAGLMGFRIPEANMTRPGIILYGVAPVPSPAAAELRTTLRLLSRVARVRELPAGRSISYGRTYTTPVPTRVATLGIGYADGWPRHLSGRGAYVSIRGQRCPVLGRVTMDLLIVDATAATGVCEGDEAELIGPELPVQQVAEWAGGIPWEIFTGLGVRLPRIIKP